MPEYLAPAVYVEETSFRPKPLEGASTSTTAFVGRTRRGPVASQSELLSAAELDLITPELITSVGDFERLYGSTSPIGSTPNYLAHAVRGFFANGGRRLYVARVMELTNDTDEARAVQITSTGTATWLTGNGTTPSARFEARFPGTAGNGRVIVSEARAPASQRSLERASAGTMVRAIGAGAAAGPASAASSLTEPFDLSASGLTLTIEVATVTATVTFNAADFDDISAATAAEIAAVLNAEITAEGLALAAVDASDPLTFVTVATGTSATITIGGTAMAVLGFTANHTGTPAGSSTSTYYVKQGSAVDSTWHNASAVATALSAIITAGSQGLEVITFNVEVEDADSYRQLFGGLGVSSLHPNYIGHVLGMVPPRRAEQLENLVAMVFVGEPTPFALRTGLTTGADSTGRAVFPLGLGSDGGDPGSERYREGLEALDAIDGISIIAAPGSSESTVAQAIRTELVANAEARGAYRIAVLDGPAAQTVGQIRNIRATMDSDHAALYHPWIVVSNPDARPGDSSRPLELAVPPSGHICGIYARNDAERGVHKAPANEVVIGALRFESNVTMGQQEVLNPEGINVLRSFRGRGHRVWGARLASSDPEFKYVNIRRYFNYISSTLDNGTQWVVFEPNNEQLWDRVTATVSDFLYNEWTNGALLGRTQDEAFFVRCGRMTMTQSDIDNGRLICEVGMAIVYPAEFVIFRIGQKTATSNS
ncbi:MAG TPA: phage tail sheath subtilisin-like domain-containing protein [Enhygromyxa sp.]|nr:phage tail sheath subtilisin-like domain-containing protein [Enhygromyxa sp.]